MDELWWPLIPVRLAVLPVELFLSTDAYHFGLLPVMFQITGPAGEDPAAAVHALVIGNIVGIFFSPFSPAMWLAFGLARAEILGQIRYYRSTICGYSIIFT